MIACLRLTMPQPGAFDALLERLVEFTPRVEVADGRWTTDEGRPSVVHGASLRLGSGQALRLRSGQAFIVYLDLEDLDWAEAVEVVQCIGQVMREQFHLSPAIGLARGRFTAHVAAATVEPNEALIIAPGQEAAFLAPFPVELLPLDDELARRLHLLGIRTLGQLAALPAGAVLTQFGRGGQHLQRLAQGRDDRPVLPHRSRAVERVARQFDGPVTDGTILEAVIRSMAEELTTRLRARGCMGRTLTLILHLEDGTTCERKLVLRRPTAGAEHIAQTLGELLVGMQVSCGVVGLEVTLTDLVPATGQQLDLFVHRTGQERRLHDVLKDLVARYGADCFYRISLTDREARLPERRFQLRIAECGLRNGVLQGPNPQSETLP